MWTDKAKPLTTQYGALVGLTALGSLVVEQLVLPQAAGYLSKLDSEMAALKKVAEKARLARANRLQLAGTTSGSGDNNSNASVVSDMEATETRKESKRAIREDEIHHCRSAMFGAIACFTQGNTQDVAVQSSGLNEALSELRENIRMN